MNRFWIFPLALGLAGTFFPIVAWMEGALLMFSSSFSARPPFLQSVVELWSVCAPWGTGIGVTMGLVAGVADVFRNGRAPRQKRPLASNIAWCVIYTHVLIFVNMMLIIWWRNASQHPLADFAVLLPLVFWLFAIVWGTIRTITTNDVLSPRVLSDKWKRSLKLMG